MLNCLAVPDSCGDILTNESIERVRKAIEEIKAGRMVILVDDEARENEGDLTMAA